MPKIMAIRSTTKDISTTRLPARYRKPSRTAAKPHFEEPWAVPVGGIFASRHVATMGAMHVSASIAYSVDRSTKCSSTPASSGPTIAPNCMTVMFSELAAGNCSTGTIRGIAADRVGLLIAKNACWTDSKHNTTQTLFSPSAACTHSRTDDTASPVDAMTNNSLRSIASAQAPPHKPKTTRGTRAKRPDSPT